MAIVKHVRTHFFHLHQSSSSPSPSLLCLPSQFASSLARSRIQQKQTHIIINLFIVLGHALLCCAVLCLGSINTFYEKSCPAPASAFSMSGRNQLRFAHCNRGQRFVVVFGLLWSVSSTPCLCAPWLWFRGHDHIWTNRAHTRKKRKNNTPREEWRVFGIGRECDFAIT